MELVKLKMVDSGPNKNYRASQVVVVDEARAKLLIKGRHARRVKEKK